MYQLSESTSTCDFKKSAKLKDSKNKTCWC